MIDLCMRPTQGKYQNMLLNFPKTWLEILEDNSEDRRGILYKYCSGYLGNFWLVSKNGCRYDRIDFWVLLGGDVRDLMSSKFFLNYSSHVLYDKEHCSKKNFSRGRHIMPPPAAGISWPPAILSQKLTFSKHDILYTNRCRILC